MKKVTLFIILPFILIAAILNPSEYKFKDEVKSEYSNSRDIYIDTIAENNFDETLNSLGNIVADNQINSKVNTDNYIVFSIAKWEDNIIGYGLFSNVYLSDEFKDKIKSIE